MPIFEINRFRKARLAAKMTQAQAAEKIGVDPTVRRTPLP